MKSYLLTAVIGVMSLLSVSSSLIAGESEVLRTQKGQNDAFSQEYHSICDANPNLPSCS